MRSLPVVEDNFEDVLGKAMCGLGLSADEVAERAGVTTNVLQALLSGQFEESVLRQIASLLSLNGDCLIELAKHAASPQVELPSGLKRHNTAFPIPGYAEMTVNSYSVVPPEQPQSACIIDAGADMAAVLEGRGDEAPAAEWALFLTHSHADHIVHFDELSEMTANQYAPAGETYGGAQSVREGDEFYIGPWRLTALETAGHSPAGMSYLLETSTVPIAFVGDALFCYSIGKVNPARYQSALSAIQEKILGLPDETILCPGHGPLTSVAFEKRHNPFFV